MEITIDELMKLDSDSYRLIDIRSEADINYGMIDGAEAIPLDRLSELFLPLSSDAGSCTEEASAHADDTADTKEPGARDEASSKEKAQGTAKKKLVLYCSRGVVSIDAADELCEKGYEAYSLKGGYISYLMYDMKRRQEEEASRPNEFAKAVEVSIHKKFKKQIWSKFIKAITEYKLLKEGDCVGVCISGGKDSMLMAKLFSELHKHSVFPFDVKYIVMDPGYSPANRQIIEDNAKRLGIPVEIFESDIFDSVYTVEKSPCYLCARMRRGHLYNFAKGLGCNKIALGHHYDDVIETILMGMLYGAQIQTMMPKLHSTNFEGMELIRPLYLIREDDIKAWRDYNGLHFIQCACKFTDTCTTCTDGGTPSKRVECKELIKKLKETNPEVEAHIFRSVENVMLDTVIAYKKDGVRHNFLDSYDK